MTVFAMLLGVAVWFLADNVVLKRYMSNASSQEAKFRKGFVWSLNIALAIIAMLLVGAVFYY